MKLENAQEQLLELSPLKLSQQFSRDDLLDLRDQLKAKRAGLIEAKDKCKNGNSIALLNIELSQVNSMLIRINETVILLDQDAKMMKKNNHSAQELAMRFFKVAEKELDSKTFNRIKKWRWCDGQNSDANNSAYRTYWSDSPRWC